MKSSFLTMIAEQMYLKRYAKSTIQAYSYWITSFIRFHSMIHPATKKESGQILSSDINIIAPTLIAQSALITTFTYIFFNFSLKRSVS
ncbi:phage integrase N-terminal SAM-like domain-containing protein [Pseudoalteromonas mariniglutinosa]|uniref:phage integrase N-terminal SAM-like domain-containing protein n=1 Tax=Pseudoalteromonas mariniglutinosa TaxID=206042 RepID=UPI00384C97F6